MAQEGLSPVKQALQAIHDLEAKLAAIEAARTEPIAIVGMACRYPGAANLAAFWRLLRRGGDAVTEVPPERWDLDVHYHPDPARPGTMTSRWAGLIDRLDEFDAAFFGISPREAPHVDPRQRLALEIAWEALEDAGILPDTLAGTPAGVFMATLTNDYDHLLFEDLRRADSYSGAGTANSIVANRLSYVLDLHGPSVALDTACSGSLVAVHLACESLRRGESTIALAGGVNVNLMPKSNVFFSKAGALSPTGRCRTFDRAADGMVRSDGAGILVLKRLSQAVADGDRIAAVIKGSAVNHDGRSNGLMAPNGDAQRAVLTEAYQRAGVSPADVQYIEAHGTGTKLGDPIEVSSLAAVLTPNRPADRMCLLGSVKTNIGHSEAAAAVAGIIKTALALHHRIVPPTVHFTEPNPLIDLHRLPFAVPTTESPWPSPDRPLIAGVSGFGFGGTNAHVVLASAPGATDAAVAAKGTGAAAAPVGPPFILPISARTPRALVALARAWSDRLGVADAPTSAGAAVGARAETARDAKAAVADLCAVAARERMHHAQRAAFVGTSAEALRIGLDHWIETNATDGTPATNEVLATRPVFVFSGQGSHWPRMGMELYAREPIFAAVIDDCDRLFAQLSAALPPSAPTWPSSTSQPPMSIRAELAREARDSRLDATEITQPAIFAVQLALFALWQSYGIAPAAVIGHSLGEVAAACAAGALSRADGARIVFHRSRLMARTAGRGRTAVVGLSLAAARDAIRTYEPALAVAGSNGPDTSVIAGDPVSVERLQRMLDARGVFCRVIPGVSIAFHSPQMDLLKPELVRALAGLAPTGSTIPIISTVTATLVNGETLDADYWGRNLRDPFLFAHAIDVALAQGANAFVEVSPHPVLSSSITACLRHADVAAPSFPVLSSLRRGEPEAATMLGQLARLYECGLPVRWTNIYRSRPRSASAPTYPWQRQRFWFDQLATPTPTAIALQPQPTKTTQTTNTAAHPLLGAADAIEPAAGTDGARVYLWETTYDEANPPHVNDHRVLDRVVLPGSAIVEIALAAARYAWPDRRAAVSDLRFEQALQLSDAGRRVQVTLTLRADAATAGVAAGPAAAAAVPELARRPDLPGLPGLTADLTLHSRPIVNGRPTGTWTRHAVCRLTADRTDRTDRRDRTDRADVPASPSVVDLAQLKARCQEVIAPETHYDAMEAGGLRYGPAFRGIRGLWAGSREAREALAEIVLPPDVRDARYAIHPAMLDAALQTVAAIVRRDDPEQYLPHGVQHWSLDHPIADRVWCHARLVTRNGDRLVADLDLLDDHGVVVARLQGLTLARFGAPRPLALAGSLIEERWESHPLPPTPATTAATAATRWLFLADTTGIAAAAANRLRARGHSVVLASPDDDLIRLIADSTPLDGIAYCPALDAADETDATATAASLVDATTRLCLGALQLTQALATTPAAATSGPDARPPRLWLVTRDASSIRPSAGAPATPASQADAATTVATKSVPMPGASLHGLALTIAQEHPELRCTTVDLASAMAEATDAAADALADELLHASDETRVAWRGRERHVARLGAWTLSATASGSVSLRGDATYLIAGGLGALGLQTASHLVRLGARYLVLTGRRGIDGASPAAKVIDELRGLGATVVVAATDVADDGEVEALFGRVIAGMPPLAGVVHAAGVLDDALIATQTGERLRRVIAPKLAGAWNLHRRTLGVSLDFFVCYSSAASLIGSAGQANYAAANACLDALAAHRRRLGLPALSINWSAWAGDGMAASEQMPQRLDARGLSMMRAGDALAILQKLMTDPACPGVIGVIPADWGRFLRQSSIGVPPRLASLAPSSASADSAPVGAASATSAAAAAADRVDLAALVASPAPARATQLRDIIRRELAIVLGFDDAATAEISPRGKYFDLGMDSLTAVEFRNRLQQTFGLPLPATMAFDYPTIETLAESIGASLAARAHAQTPAPPVADLVSGANTDPNTDLLDALPAHEIARLLARELDEEGRHVE